MKPPPPHDAKWRRYAPGNFASAIYAEVWTRTDRFAEWWEIRRFLTDGRYRVYRAGREKGRGFLSRDAAFAFADGEIARAEEPRMVQLGLLVGGLAGGTR